MRVKNAELILHSSLFHSSFFTYCPGWVAGTNCSSFIFWRSRLNSAVLVFNVFQQIGGHLIGAEENGHAVIQLQRADDRRWGAGRRGGWGILVPKIDAVDFTT